MIRSHAFPRPHGLRSRAEFNRVFDARMKQSRGPLSVFAVPGDLSYARLGIQVPRRVGTAVQRNRIKRLLRETFRLMQHDLPRAYDVVIVVRPHEPLMLADYQRILSAVMVKLHNEWIQRDSDL